MSASQRRHSLLKKLNIEIVNSTTPRVRNLRTESPEDHKESSITGSHLLVNRRRIIRSYWRLGYCERVKCDDVVLAAFVGRTKTKNSVVHTRNYAPTWTHYKNKTKFESGVQYCSASSVNIDVNVFGSSCTIAVP